MKKSLYMVCKKLDIEDTYLGFFKKIKEKGYVLMKARYIYASSEEEAINKYIETFDKEYISVTSLWIDAYASSDNIKVCDFTNRTTKIIDQYPCCINDDVHPESIDELKELMSAYDFRDWWHDNNSDDDILTVLETKGED